MPVLAELAIECSGPTRDLRSAQDRQALAWHVSQSIRHATASGIFALALALHDPNDHPDNDDDEDDGGKRQQYPSHREAEEPPLGVKRHGH
jgi:hypothetical protein